MSNSIAPDHPTTLLFFYLEEDPDEELKDKLSDLIEILANSTDWTIGPPVFIDETQPDGDEPDIRTVGGAFELYTGAPGYSAPAEIGRRQFKEVERIVSALRDLSGRIGVTIVFQENANTVGRIENGVVEKAFQFIFLERWLHHLTKNG